MVDFSRLMEMDPAERAERDAADRERAYAAEEAQRDTATKRALVVTLEHEPEVRSLSSGERVILLRGTEDGQSKPLSAVYAVPSRTRDSEDREAALDVTLRSLGGGDRVSLAGQWAKRGWKDRSGAWQEKWEFKTQAFEKGDVPLERMIENVRADRLGRPAPVAQETEREVARRAPHGVAAAAGVGR